MRRHCLSSRDRYWRRVIVGRSTLRKLLQELEKTDRRPTLQRIDQIYPGGLTRLEYDFFRWAQSDMTPHWY